MIGILLALQINNWNDRRKNQAKNLQLLKRAYLELAHNLEHSDKVVQFYRSRERDIYRVLNKEVTLEDYKNSNLVKLILGFWPVKIINDDAQNLKSFSDKLIGTQDTLVYRIIELYKAYKPIIDIFDEQMSNLARENIIKIRDSQDWYHHLDWRKLDDEDYNYFLDNTFYLNRVKYYELLALYNHHVVNMNFNTEAKSLYRDLSTYLDVEPDSSILKSPKQFYHYLGKYKLEDGKEVIEIKEKNNRLVCIWPNDGPKAYEFYPENDTLFVSRKRFSKLIRNENKKVTGMVRSWGHLDVKHYTKVE